jgi:hypothetical protein
MEYDKYEKMEKYIMTEKHKLPSGAMLEITLLPFEDANDLMQTVVNEIKILGIDLRGLDLRTLFEKEHTTLIGPVCSLLASKQIREAVKKCWPRATYNGVKIDSSTFEAKEARGDYLFTSFYLLKENISPFFESLLLFLTI